jgi:DNA-binding response OmpR family regulator
LEETEPQKKIDWLVLDHDRKEAYVDGRSVKLARKEYLLLKLLYENAGKVCEREEIAAFVWPEYASDGVADEQIDQLVRSVRKLVDPDPKKPPRLVTRRKFGYLLEIGD